MESRFRTYPKFQKFCRQDIVYCGRHVSNNALFYVAQAIRNHVQLPFSQRSLVKLHHYRVTIRGSKLPLFQVFFTVLALFWRELSTKVRKILFLSCELVAFSLSRKVPFSIQVLVKSHLRYLRLIVKLLYWSNCHMISKLSFIYAIFSCFTGQPLISSFVT